MPFVEEVHKDDIGTVFLVTLYDGSTALDVSGAIVKQIVFQDADGTVTTQTATFTTDGTDGKIQYTTIADDLSVVGKWKIQGYVQLASGQWKSNVGNFRVYSNL